MDKQNHKRPPFLRPSFPSDDKQHAPWKSEEDEPHPQANSTSTTGIDPIQPEETPLDSINATFPLPEDWPSQLITEPLTYEEALERGKSERKSSINGGNQSIDVTTNLTGTVAVMAVEANEEENNDKARKERDRRGGLRELLNELRQVLPGARPDTPHQTLLELTINFVLHLMNHQAKYLSALLGAYGVLQTNDGSTVFASAGPQVCSPTKLVNCRLQQQISAERKASVSVEQISYQLYRVDNSAGKGPRDFSKDERSREMISRRYDELREILPAARKEIQEMKRLNYLEKLSQKRVLQLALEYVKNALQM